MHTDAFLWWKSIKGDDFSLIIIPKPQEMYFILPYLSTIGTLFVSPITPNDEYWNNLYECFKKLINKNDLINPNHDFEKFIIEIYPYRELLLPNSIKSCINFINCYYNYFNDDFFISYFLLGISNINLCINTMLFLHKNEDIQWLNFISKPGSVERLFDIYVTFLSINTDLNIIIDQICLSELFTLLFTNNNSKIILSDLVLNTFYSKLFKLIKYSPFEYSISFLRLILILNDFWFPKYSIDITVSRISTLIASSINNYIIRPLILFKVKKYANIFISYKKLIPNIIKQNNSEIFDFEILFDLALNGNDESKFYVIKFFCQNLTQNKLMMRSSAYFLSKLLILIENNSEILFWIKKFLYGLFSFLKFSFLKKKYKNRTLMICEILNSTFFNELKWFKDHINGCASAAFYIGKKIPLFKLFFKIKKSLVNLYEKGLLEFGKKRNKIKTFPFKSRGYELIDLGGIKTHIKQVKDSTNRYIEENVLKLGLLTMSNRYIYFDYEVSQVDQQKNIFLLEDFIEEEQLKLEKVEFSNLHKTNLIPKDYIENGFMILTFLVNFLIQIEFQIFEYQKNALKEGITIAQDILKAISTNSNLFADLKSLSRDLNIGCAASTKYQSLKKQKFLLKKYLKDLAKQYKLPFVGSQELFHILNTPNINYKFNLVYCPPSNIDDQIWYYIKIHKQFFDNLNEIVLLIKSNEYEIVISLVLTLVFKLKEKIRINTEYSSSQLFCSIIRIIFDFSYDSNSLLNQFNLENSKFLIQSEEFLLKSISELNFRNEIQLKVLKRGNIKQLVNMFPKSLKNIEFLTNPIDILYNINLIISSLSSIIGNIKLNDEEIKKFLISIISLNPPINFISILRFMDKWGNINMSLQMTKSLITFLDSINVFQLFFTK